MIDVSTIAANVERAKAIPDLGLRAEWWLTFCIAGPESSLGAVASALAAESGQNLDGVETGFLNAKLAVASEPRLIVERVVQVAHLVAEAGAELVSVDADSSPDVKTSRFSSLWVA